MKKQKQTIFHILCIHADLYAKLNKRSDNLVSYPIHHEGV